jgi:hypothetical protein
MSDQISYEELPDLWHTLTILYSITLMD